MKDFELVKKAVELHLAGKNNCQISRELLVNRRTVTDWIKAYKERGINNIRKVNDGGASKLCGYLNNIVSKANNAVTTDDEEKAYCYMLGLYLGDGCINKMARTYLLRISQFSEHKDLINECISTLQLLFPNNSVNWLKVKGSRCIVVYTNNCHMPVIFPQHGPGEKHNRKLTLKKWQKEVIKKHPENFIKGLIDSDGCKFKHTDVCKKTGEKRTVYQFTNKSEDIKDFFCWACNLIDVKCSRKIGYKNVYIYGKESIDILDKFIPFKS